MFSDVDIDQAISTKEIVIDPFEDKFLTGVGYDLRVGAQGFSWKSKKEINIETKGKLVIEPKDTVVIRTLESIKLSKKIGATIHSVVSQIVPNGLSHISTTIDPGWQGRLLVSIHNHRDTSVELKYKDYFCTVCFYNVNSEAGKSPNSRADRDDIWDRLLEKAKEESQRFNLEEQRKTNRRFLVRAIFAAIVIIIGFVSSFIVKPEYGTIVATLIAALIPLFIEILKNFD